VGRHVADLVAASEARLDGRCWRRSDCARRRSGCARRSRRQRKEEERLRKEEKRLREEEELELRKVAWEKARLRQEEDEERRRIAVTEALEVRKSELERELQENDLNRQQQAELKQLKVTLGELAAASRPENRWTKSIESAAHLDAFVRSMPAADQTARHLTGPLSAVHNREVGSSLPTPPHLPSPVRRVRSIGQFAAS
jgi:hypothetical protein